MELTLQLEVKYMNNEILKNYNPCFYGINFAIIVGRLSNEEVATTILVFMELTLQY